MSLSAQTGAPPSELGTILELIASPAAMKAKMAEYAAAKKAAEEAVALVGPAQQIPALAEAAKKDRAVAAEELAAVRAQAQGLVDQGRASAEALVKAANEKAEDTIKQAEVARKEADAHKAASEKAMRDLNALSRKHDAREKVLSEREAVLAGAQNDHAKAVAEHKKAAEVLKGVREALIAQHNEHLKALSV